MSLRRFAPRLALVLLVVAIALLAGIYRDHINLAVLDAGLVSLGPWAPVGYIFLYALGTMAFVPGAALSLAGGALFGPLWGSLYNLAGATLGATLAFSMARFIAADWVARKAGGLLKRLIEGVEAEGWRFVAFVRLVPLFPFNLSNYALGLTRISLRHYVLATLVCMIPGAVAYTWLGHASRGALSGQADAIRYGALALGLLAAIAWLPGFISRLCGPFAWMEASELKRRLDSGEGVTIIDVRGPEEFSGPLGHIATARNIPLAALNNRLDELAGRQGTPIVLVCRTDKRSARAAQVLAAAGFKQLNVLRRGMEQWHACGLPVQGRTREARTDEQ